MPFPKAILHRIANNREEIAKSVGLLFLLLSITFGFGLLLWYLGNTTCKEDQKLTNERGPCNPSYWLDNLAF